MRCKIQFGDTQLAEDAFEELKCVKVLMGSAVAISYEKGYINDLGKIIWKYKAYTEGLTKEDSDALIS